MFKKSEGYYDLPVQIPCGKCIGCRLEHSRKWAMRAVLEAQTHSENSFITLTYDDDHLPDDGSIHKEELQKFFKRLRKALQNDRIKYLACGEYGESYSRPHYHSCIFGHSFPDRQLWTVQNGNKLFRSPLLEKVWDKGHSLVGDFTFETAAYVARYVTKKLTGEFKQFYEWYDLQPEFALMSRGGRTGKGLAREWYDEYKQDVLTTGRIIIRNDLQVAMPRYYDSIVAIENPEVLETLKSERRKHLKKVDNSPDRLAAREEVQNQRFKKLKRSFENEETDLCFEGC